MAIAKIDNIRGQNLEWIQIQIDTFLMNYETLTEFDRWDARRQLKVLYARKRALGGG